MKRIRSLTKENIDNEIQKYLDSISSIEINNSQKGINLLRAMKRDPIGAPSFYKDLSYFEAANRIMTDLVIYYGVKWLLNSSDYKFNEFEVEFGNENKNDHDVMSKCTDGRIFIGEAFNVAPSFFQGKKSKMLNKLRNNDGANYKFIIANSDAVEEGYTPKLGENEYILLVDIEGNKSKLHPLKEV